MNLNPSQVKKDPLAQITLQISENKSEQISLFPGDNINKIINDFSKNYSLEKTVSELIKEELVRQLMQNDFVAIDNSGVIKWSEDDKIESGDFLATKIYKKSRKKI